MAVSGAFETFIIIYGLGGAVLVYLQQYFLVEKKYQTVFGKKLSREYLFKPSEWGKIRHEAEKALTKPYQI